MHRRQRKMLNPVFSIKHMRHMIPIFNDVGHKVSFTSVIYLDGPID